MYFLKIITPRAARACTHVMIFVMTTWLTTTDGDDSDTVHDRPTASVALKSLT